MTRLPARVEDLRGLRAARWIRESTAEQRERYGPDAQRRIQDADIRRLGLVDTGLAWEPAHSGATVYRSDAMREMLDAARAGAFDVLVVAYLSRWQRNLRQTLNLLEDQLHPAGVAVWFCDEEILSSNERSWDQLVDEAKAAESWLRRHRRRVAEGYAAKFERHADPGGNPPLGFRRVDGLIEVDPDTIGRAVAVFERYAAGTLSLVALEAETGIDAEALKVMIRNPIYNGWVRRHPKGADVTQLPAAWRDHPPVPDELWARVQQVRADRDTGGGRSTQRHVHMLAGRLFCPCGERIRAEATTKKQRWVFRRYRHRSSCEHWTQDTRIAGWFEDPIAAQITGMRLGAGHLASLRALAASDARAPDPSSLRRRQMERELEDLARRHARRAIATDAYLREHARITALLDAPAERATTTALDPDRAIAWLRDIRRTWTETDDEGRRGIVAALYERITVTSEGFVGARLTQQAQRHLVALAMPETVALARPEGREHRPATVTIPIEGRRDWRAAVRSA